MAYFYRYEYDVVIAFSAPDRSTAEEFARLLAERNIKISLDELKDPDVVSAGPAAHLAETFGRKARFYLLLISRSFPQTNWSDVEQMTSPTPGSSVIPVRLDDTDMQGLEDPTQVKDLRSHSKEDIVDLIAGTIVREKGHPGPPSQSHDLRSGNVPSTKDRNEP
ncbi:MAG TPA: TIR domain-containing protein [Anaerolineales bacterium]|nr:TIR domain-containing protein [Anaerolineales bacterium]